MAHCAIYTNHLTVCLLHNLWAVQHPIFFLVKWEIKGGQIDRYKIVNLIPKSDVSNASHQVIRPEHIKVTDKCAQYTQYTQCAKSQGVVDLYE